MNILCKMFGHKPPRLTWENGFPFPGGKTYLKISMPPIVDGVGRQHVYLKGECARCEAEFSAYMAYLPTPTTNGDK